MSNHTTREHVISGDIIQVVNNTDDTHFGYTTANIELQIEEDEGTAEVSTQRRRIRKRSYNQATLSVESLIGTGLETMSEAGMIDPDDEGKVLFDESSRTWSDGAKLRVFEDVGDAPDLTTETPEQVVLVENVEWKLDSGINYSDDFAMATLLGTINGDIYLDHDETTTT